MPPNYKSASGFNLGKWCGHRRRERAQGRLSAKRKAALDALGFVWAPHRHAFERGLAELAAYVAAHGSTRMPDGHRTASGFGLGAWCKARRTDMKAGRLPAERVAALEALGFDTDPLPAAFDRGMAALIEYVGIHGDANVATSYRTPSGFNLGKWCSHRRNEHKSGLLSPERVEELEVLGFVWDAIQDRFDTGLAELAAYTREHRDARVPQRYRTSSGFKLGVSCRERRTDRRLGRLTEERVDALDALGFVWNLFEDAFNQGVAELADYVAESGDAQIPQGYRTSSGFNLGAWCSARRSEYKRGQLAAKRIAALNALGFVWDTRAPSTTASSSARQRL